MASYVGASGERLYLANDRVFPALVRPVCRYRITTAVVRDATHWDEVVTAQGFEYLRRHAFGHTGLTWMADAGVPVHVLRKIAGHGSITTTQRYQHPDSAAVSAAGDSLTAFLRPPHGPQMVPRRARRDPHHDRVQNDETAR